MSGECDDGVSRLLGMDIVRLVLERAKTSKEAVEIAGALMEAHGQGGNCEEGGSWCYENGFLFADSNEAWVFETAGIHWWAAERVGKGKSRNISNGITIRKPDRMHAGLASHAIAKGWWKSTPEDFDWKVAMLGGSSSAAELEPEGRERAGKEWLAKLSGPGKSFTWRDMATILRDTDSGICMTGGFESTGSQISVLHSTVEKPVHFFTTNSNPEIGCYKPFGFDAGLAIAQTPSRPDPASPAFPSLTMTSAHVFSLTFSVDSAHSLMILGLVQWRRGRHDKKHAQCVGGIQGQQVKGALSSEHGRVCGLDFE